MITLERFSYGGEGAFGRLYFGDNYCYTVENPWLDNRPFYSCIPEGIYKLTKSRSEKFGREMYEVMEVHGRNRILIHKGNTILDLEGCIAPGLALGVLGIRWAVLNSTGAFNRLYAFLDQMENPSIQIVHQTGKGILK